MTRRSIILYLIAAVFLFLLAGSAFLIKQRQDFKQTIADIPEFCLLQAVDSQPFSNAQLAKGKPVILIYLHPECDLCQIEARQLQQKAGKTEDIQWVLVSPAENDTLRKFVETYHLVDISSVVVLMDTQYTLYDCLQVAHIPTSYIYDRRHRLVTIIQGLSKLEKLMQLANQ